VFTLFTFAICVINFNSLIGDQLDRDSSPLFTPGDTLISKPKIWPEPAQWFWVAKVLRLSCSHSSRELSHRKICMTVMSEERTFDCYENRLEAINNLIPEKIRLLVI